MIFKKNTKAQQGTSYSDLVGTAVRRNSIIGVSVTACADCAKKNIGSRLYDAFAWGSNGMLLMHYDKERDELLIEQDTLMRLIKMVNPAQKTRTIRLANMTFEDGKMKWTPVE